MLLAWLVALAPTLAFAAVGLLGSVALGRSPMGLLMPALLALVLAARPAAAAAGAVRVALPSYAFLAWRGLFTEPAQTGPVVVGVVVGLVWAVAATALLAYLLFMRRDFTDLAYDGAGRRVARAAVLPLAACSPSPSPWSPRSRRRPAPASTARSWRARSPPRTATCTACSRANCAVRTSPRRSCAPRAPATRAARWSRTSAPATTGAAS